MIYDRRISPARCFEVARCLLAGMSDKEIAGKLGMPYSSVKGALRRLYDEFEIDDGHLRVKLAVKLSGFPIFK